MSLVPSEGDGSRLDSALYFAGGNVLQASNGFMPMFSYSTVDARPRIDAGYFDRDVVLGARAQSLESTSSYCLLLAQAVVETQCAGVPVLKAFSECLDDQVYDNCRTLRLFRASFTAGSMVPLTPVTCGEPAVLFTARHATGTKASPSNLQYTAAIHAKFYLHPKVSPARLLLLSRTVQLSCTRLHA